MMMLGVMKGRAPDGGDYPSRASLDQHAEYLRKGRIVGNTMEGADYEPSDRLVA
jgi:hypothetical protein